MVAYGDWERSGNQEQPQIIPLTIVLRTLLLLSLGGGDPTFITLALTIEHGFQSALTTPLNDVPLLPTHNYPCSVLAAQPPGSPTPDLGLQWQ